jgi:hypothetical protein
MHEAPTMSNRRAIAEDYAAFGSNQRCSVRRVTRARSDDATMRDAAPAVGVA